ncbi:hypothetical protein H0E87_031498, partial [Populus deltoides]
CSKLCLQIQIQPDHQDSTRVEQTGQLVPLVTSWTMPVLQIPTHGRMQPNSPQKLQHFTWMH